MADYPDFEGDKAGLYLIPEWAAKEAKDHSIYGSGANIAWGNAKSISYIVPAGKTFFVTYFTFGSVATLIADADNNQMVAILIYKSFPAPLVTKLGMAVNAGFALSLNKPIVFTTGQWAFMDIYNYANHNCDLFGSFGGYLTTP